MTAKDPKPKRGRPETRVLKIDNAGDTGEVH